MRSLSWLRSPIRVACKPSRRTHPGLEALEARWMLSVVPVTSALDDLSRGTLRYAVAHAGNGDTILLSGAVAQAGISLTNGELIVTQQNLTIRSASASQPVTISGNSQSRIFEVAPGASITLSDLTVTGGSGVAGVPGRPHDGRGGGILVDEGSTLVISDSTITNNSASAPQPGGDGGLGGGIADYGTLTVNHCTVSNNSALSTYGGGIAVFSGAPFTNPFTATLAITDSTVTGNTAVQNGGGIANVYSTIVLNNCDVTGNTASINSGGGLNNHAGTVTVTHSRVDGNFAPDGVGGGIVNYQGILTINNNSEVNGNNAYFGGGIDNSGTLTMLDSRLSQNSVSPYGIGGGLLNVLYPGTAVMTNVVVSGNTASTGGAIFSSGDVTLSGCTLSGNVANNYGGAIANYGTLTVLNHTLFSYNSAYGAGAISNGGTATILDSTLDHNFTLDAEYGEGGAILNDGAMTIARSAITHNSAGWGGGISLDYGTLTLTDCILSGNAAAEDGGAIFNYDTLSLDHCTVSNNTAVYGGGGIANFALLTLSNSTFAANTPDNLYDFGFYTDAGGNTFS